VNFVHGASTMIRFKSWHHCRSVIAIISARSYYQCCFTQWSCGRGQRQHFVNRLPLFWAVPPSHLSPYHRTAPL